MLILAVGGVCRESVAILTNLKGFLGLWWGQHSQERLDKKPSLNPLPQAEG